MVKEAVSPLVAALMESRATAAVVDFDHYRIHGGMAVETDYIISVQPTGDAPARKEKEEVFEGFRISKTYSAFRTLAHQLQKVSKGVTKSKDSWESLSPSAKSIVKLSESVLHLVDSQRTEYLGKVNFTYVKSMAKQRSQIINDILDLLITNFPQKIKGEDPSVGLMASAIETFFLTDFCVEEDEEEDHGSKKSLLGGLTPSKLKRKASRDNKESKSVPSTPALKEESATSSKKKKAVRISEPEDKVEIGPGSLSSPVVPYSRKSRRSLALRAQDEDFLKQAGGEANLLLDDDRNQTSLFPSYSKPVTVGKSGGSKIGDIVENNPLAFAMIAAVSIYVLRVAAEMTITMDTDIAMLIVFASFCVGFHTPRPQGGIDKPPPVKLKTPLVSFQADTRSSFERGPALLRKSMSRRSVVSPTSAGGKVSFMVEEIEEAEAEIEEGEQDPLIQSPLPVFPEGAELGSEHNCWSEPTFGNFKVRGPNYLSDKKKEPSGPFVFPVRGVDLFLTDLCPENCGSNSGVMGGNLRDVPTFIINFRLPWGVLLFYFEIPKRFIPFLEARYEPAQDEADLPSMDSMSPSDRTVCRYLLADDDYKNDHLKIVPVVVKGPWVVKSVVGGKPAIIGNKMPVNYIYQPAEGKKAPYLEADLDIVASSTARGILSVCTSATKDLTIDLGFVVEGRHNDELPEQMLVGARLHGIDPLNAPPLPPSKDMFLLNDLASTSTDDED